MRENSERKLPEKVELMYQAVIDMLSDGIDINSMKVADITRRAGIGKGTAYEYFQSKEELIQEALNWNFHVQMLEVRQAVGRQQSFRNKVYALLDWMEWKIPSRKTFMEMITMSAGGCCISKEMKGYLKAGRYPEMIYEALEEITETGIQEGVIRKDMPKYTRQTGIMSQVIVFFLYLHREKLTNASKGSVSSDRKTGQSSFSVASEIKDEVYENILRLCR